MRSIGRGRPLNAPAAFIHPCQPIVAKQPPSGLVGRMSWSMTATDDELKHDGYLPTRAWRNCLKETECAISLGAVWNLRENYLFKHGAVLLNRMYVLGRCLRAVSWILHLVRPPNTWAAFFDAQPARCVNCRDDYFWGAVRMPPQGSTFCLASGILPSVDL